MRPQQHTYARFLDGQELLFDNLADSQQRNNLIDDPASQDIRAALSQRTDQLMALRGDALLPGSSYTSWFDEQRRVVVNAYGALADPEAQPDWSLLGEK